MSPLEILPWVIAGLGLLSFIATATVLVKSAADQGVKQTQKDSIEALVERARIKDMEISDLIAADLAKDAKIAALEQQVKVLEGVANSGDKIDAMRDAVLESIMEVHTGLGKHNALALERVDNVLRSIGTLPKGIAAELATEIVKAMRSA